MAGGAASRVTVDWLREHGASEGVGQWRLEGIASHGEKICWAVCEVRG